MNWTKMRRAIIFFSIVLILFLTWHFRNFQLLLLLIFVSLAVIVIDYPKLRSVTVPITTVILMLNIIELLMPIYINFSWQKKNQDLEFALYQHFMLFDPDTTYAKSNYFQRINGFGYKITPGKHSSRLVTWKGEAVYDVEYTIGSDGYRKEVVTDHFDAFIYGGSFTFGEGLNDDETLSFYLSKNHGVVAKNVGIHGYGMHQALYNIENGLISAQPNGINILLTSAFHALRSACKPVSQAGTPRYILENGTLIQKGVCPKRTLINKVLEKSLVWTTIKQALSNDNNRITDSDVDLYLAIIKKINELSVKNKASLIIAYIDIDEISLSHTTWTNEKLITALRKLGFQVVDVTLAKRIEDLDPTLYIHELDKHPSALANQSRAAILKDFLMRNDTNNVTN